MADGPRYCGTSQGKGSYRSGMNSRFSVLAFALMLTGAALIASARAGGREGPVADGLVVFDAAAGLLRAHYVGPEMSEVDARLSAQRRALLMRCPASAPCPVMQGRAAVQALVWSLGDPHTFVNWDVLPVAAGVASPERRVWSGMLVRLLTADVLAVVHVDHGGPAERAGLRPGDEVLAVGARDDLGAAGLRASFLEEAEEAGRPYSLRVRRAQRGLTLTVTPGPWFGEARPSLRWQGRVAVISVPNFAVGTGAAFNSLVDRATAQQAAGLVVDLRWNGGGSASDCLSAAQSLAGDVNLIGVGRSGQPLSEWRVTAEAQAARARVQRPWAGPLALLVSSRTASCGEVLAYFGQRAGGTVVGRPTAGVMSTGTRGHVLPGGGLLFVSEVRPTLDGAVRLPGRIMPDVVMADGDDVTPQVTDPALDAALRLVQSK